MIKHIYKKINDNEIECYNIELITELDIEIEMKILMNLINISKNIIINRDEYIEYGPNIEMITPWCSNVMSILKKCKIKKIKRIEKSQLIKKEKFNEKIIDKMTERIYKYPIEKFENKEKKEEEKEIYEVENIKEENKKEKLGFDEQDIEYYNNIFNEMNKKPTNIELYDLAQSNSEHSRHWFFNGKFKKEDEILEESLFEKIKNTLKIKENKINNSVVSFSDNSSAIKGSKIDEIKVNIENNKYEIGESENNIVFTAETHNFPTSIAPFPGAATGTGGRIRDNQSIGRGGLCIGGTVGYSVGKLEGKYEEKNNKTLIEASNGASDYGNKFGEPLIQGFCREYGETMDDNERIEYVKPIMFSGGIGQMKEIHTKKEKSLNENILIVRLGGPAYKIGIGGGSASSRDQKTKNIEIDYNAVQRGDPEMENKLNRVIRTCIELNELNPILSIHDQGAGGMGNVTKEIIYPYGAEINLNKVILGDKTMNSKEIWVSEHQEQNTILINKNNYELLKQICERENLPVTSIGHINNSGKIIVYNEKNVEKNVKNKKENKIKPIVNLDLELILGKKIIKKQYELKEKSPYIRKNISEEINNKLSNKNFDKNFFNNILIKILESTSVCSKRFLTNKVDRSVTGLIAQQQCVGPLHTPLCDYAVISQSYYNDVGATTAIGERPIIGLLDERAMARMSIGEMLTNIMWCKISSLENIRCSGNWMWPMKFEGEKIRLYNAVESMCECMIKLGIGLDGGKDSLSMSYQDNKTKEIIKSPGTLVISGYVDCPNINIKITPEFKQNDSNIYYINLSKNKYRLGGSIFMQVNNELSNKNKKCPDMEDSELLKYVFNNIQKLISKGIILSGHDVSDGGLLITLIEMCIAGNMGYKGEINIKENIYNLLFSEELGIIIEIKNENINEINKIFGESYCYLIGKTIKENKFNLKIKNNELNIEYENKITTLRKYWESTSKKLDILQTNKENINEEYELYNKCNIFEYKFNEIISEKLLNMINNLDINNLDDYIPKVAIIREEGSNGDREMAAIFKLVGFDVYDITMNDLLNKKINLNIFRGIIFVGGFSYSDVFGAARGWYQIIISNQEIKKQFDEFYKRNDTFSLGICNGCQLMSLLGYIPECKLLENESKRFESRYIRVKIKKNNSIMLNNFEGSILGIWIAHAEGRIIIDKEIYPKMCPILYIDENNLPTKKYPFNPNGSDYGIGGICTSNGRHLGMMPHPERSFMKWQRPINSQYNYEGNINMEMKNIKYSPWYYMFKNAYIWCKKNK